MGLADPDTLDLVLDEQLATLQFSELQVVCRRMCHGLGDLVFESPMLPLQFRKMRLDGHVEWLLETFQQTPLTRVLCHEPSPKSIIRPLVRCRNSRIAQRPGQIAALDSACGTRDNCLLVRDTPGP